MTNIQELRTFLLAAQSGSFTKTAAQLGVSRSAISQSVSQLEQQLGVRLFQRTTRHISTTDVGQRLFEQLSPLFDQIDFALSDTLSLENQLQGRLRIAGTIHAIGYDLWHKFSQFMQDNPNVELELQTDVKFTDIVAQRFDAGIRTGNFVEQDMVAVKISPDIEMCCVAKPKYLAQFGSPNTPDELKNHRCIGFRLPTHGGLLDWEFQTAQGEKIVHKTHSKLIVSDPFLLVQACLDGLGIIWCERSYVAKELAVGRLQTLLDDWVMPYPAYYLYYPNRQVSPLLKALVGYLRLG